MATIVVYGGGFQPFHVGHLSSYLQAKKAFPNAAFYVAASNDTKQRPIPFQDKQFLAQQAGVKDPMVETRNPINPVEILSQYNPDKDVYIIVRSERDPMPYTKKDGSPAYYQPYVPGEPMQPFSKHGYVFVTKKHTFMVGGHEIYSGTQVRDMYTNADDNGRLELIHELYPNSKQQRTIKKMLDKYLAAAPATTGSAINKLKQKKLAEHIKKIRPLLKEATGAQKLKFMKLMKSALNENRIMDRDAKINAYYVSPRGDRHRVAENIPYYLLDKLVPLLTKKYAITMNDIEVRPADKTQYRRSSQPELAEKKENKVDSSGYDEFTDPTAKRALDIAKQHYPGSKSRQEAFVKFVQRALSHAEEDDKQQDAQIQRLEQELAQIRQALMQPKEVNEDASIAQPGQLVKIIQAPRNLDLLPGETFEVRSSNEQGVTLKHGMGTKFDNVIFPHGTYKILDAQGVAEDSELPVNVHKSPYEGSDDELRYTTMFNASPNSSQRFAKYIISKGGKARIGKRGQDYYVYHNTPISKEEWRKSEQQGVDETKVSKYKDLGATNQTTHFIKNVTTGEIVSPHRGKQDAEDALVSYYRGPSDGNEYKIVRARKEVDESLKGKLAAAALGAAALGGAGDANAIAGAIPTPSHQAAMYKAAADSNRAEAIRQAELQKKADAERLQKNTEIVDKEQRVNHHLIPANETALSQQNPKADLDAKRQALQQMEREPGHDKNAIRQRKLDLDKEARALGLSEDYLDE